MKPASQPRPIEPNNGSGWVRSRPVEERLSKSLGSSFFSRTASMKRSTSDVSSISYSGYLLKRSNLPHEDSYQKPSVLPLDTALGTAVASNEYSYVLEPQSQVMTELLSEGDGDLTDAPANKPQHLMVNSTTANETSADENEEETTRSPLEQSIDHIASFFGMRKKEQTTTEENDEYPPPNEPPVPPLVCPATPPQPIGTRSAPISVTSKLQSHMPDMPFDVNALRFLHRGDSAPMMMNPLSQAAKADTEMPPADFVDPTDGHIWRAKYCVLEDGILYFYRNAIDGESQEAKVERTKSLQLYETTPNATPDAEDLSRSPTPRKLLNSYVQQEAAGFIHEKRVFLDRVGAVRSADHEYGECSFELLAVEDDSDDAGICMRSSFSSDKLVLRARNADEMREWLFQFDRYLDTLMKNIIDTVGSGGLTVPVGDIHHPSFAMTHFPPHELGLTASKYSPRSRAQTGAHIYSSLFHGHGQSRALRRKRTSGKKDTPSSTPSGSPSYPGFDYAAASKTPQYATKSATPVEKLPPEVSRQPQTCPESERPPPAPKHSGKYVPPRLRNEKQSDGKSPRPKTGRSLSDLLMEEMETTAAYVRFDEAASSPVNNAVFEMSLDEPRHLPAERYPREYGVDESIKNRASPFKLGGCADPRVVVGSILDPMFKSRSESNLGQVHTEDYGAFGGGNREHKATNGSTVDTSLQWEIGAVSKCGVRDSNEDSYLVASNLLNGFESLHPDENGLAYLPSWAESGSHYPGLFCVFDGHNGNHAARFAAEMLPRFLVQESRVENQVDGDVSRGEAETMEEVLRNAIASLDDAFCLLCTEDGRDWESGATAMVALVAHEHLVLANLGDCRGVMCRSLYESDIVSLDFHNKEGWSKLDIDTEEQYPVAVSSFYREVNDVHSPSRPDERERIQEANGWVTTETEIPIGQLQRMDFCDEDVVEILKRHYSDRYSGRECSSSAPQRIMQISRVCGDLAVSRALGDHEYKAAFNILFESNTEDRLNEWHSPMLFLLYPNDHSRRFRGDLVSPVPELRRLKLAEKGAFHEFLLLACDGLWDVMDPDDAIRVTRGLLFEKKWEAKRVAARLAELAIHLGSSDNVTVIVVRFFKEVENE